jgi:hypothetical protein
MFTTTEGGIMKQELIRDYLAHHPELDKRERRIFEEGFCMGYEQQTKTVDRLREGLLMMSLEIYAQQLQRNNPRYQNGCRRFGKYPRRHQE